MFIPRHRSLSFEQFWNRWPGFLQCEQITTAEGVDVTTIADSRPFAICEGPYCIALFIITARSGVISSSASRAMYYLKVFIRASFRHYAQYAIIVEYLSHVHQFIP